MRRLSSVHSKRRFLLSDRSVSNELQIKLNSLLLESTSSRIGFHSEMTAKSEHGKPIKFGELVLTAIRPKEKQKDSQTDSKTSESDEDGESEQEGGESEDESSSESEEESSDGEEESSEGEEESNPNNHVDNSDHSSSSSCHNAQNSTHASSVRPSFVMQIAASLTPTANKFIDEAKLTAPIRRFKEEI